MKTDKPDVSVPRGFIIDLDGTLADTLDDITAAVNHVAGSKGVAPLSRERVKLIVGEGVNTLVARATGCTDESTIDAMVHRFLGYYREHYMDHTVLYPGWDAVLDELVRRGAALAVLSNKPHDVTCRICDKLLSRWPFVHVGGEIEGFPLKPDPTRALAICEMMDRRPDQVWFVGDSETDVETARRGGLRSAVVTWGFRSREALGRMQPDAIVDRPAELIGLIDSMGGTM